MIRDLEEEWKNLGFNNNDKLKHCLSYDGDADRLVYFIPDFETKLLKVIDGEKILSLLTMSFFKILHKIEFY